MRKTKDGIPALVSLILNIITLGDNEFSMTREISEEFEDIAASQGPAAARRWIWEQILRSMPLIIKDSIACKASMLRSYLVIALRNIKRRKSYSSINILGLTLGITCFISLMMYVEYELGYDSFHAKGDRIYRVGMYHEGWSIRGLNTFGVSNGAIVPALLREYPEVERAARLQPASSSLKYKEASFLEEGLYADKDFLNIFTFPLAAGNPDTALELPFSILLSKRLARKLFGPEDPMEKTITGFDGNTFTVTGVFDEVPDNSHLQFSFLLSFSSLYTLRTDDIDNEWGIINYMNYVLLRDNVSPVEFEEKLAGVVERYHAADTAKRRYFLQPLRDIHLRGDILDYDSGKSDMRYIYLLSSIAFIILVIACVNYINLATSQASLRGKEVAIRRTIGAVRPELIGQFLGESLVLTFISLMASLLAVYYIHPYFKSIFDRDIPLDILFSPASIAGLFGVALFAGLLSGSYPAFLLSSMKPAIVLKGADSSDYSRKRFRLRNLLVVFQFITTIVLITATLVIQKQLHYIKNKDLGYNRDNVITVRLCDTSRPDVYETVKGDLLDSPDIISASVSDKAPIRLSQMNTAAVENDDRDGFLTVPQVCFFYVDHDFIDLYDIKIKEGRGFSPDYSSDERLGVIINDTAARMLGSGDPLGRSFSGGNVDGGRIIGVVEDFHYAGLKNKIGPMAFVLNPSRAEELSIRITGNNIKNTIDHINATLMTHFDDFTANYSFLDDRYNSLYSSEARMGNIILAFSVIAISIAAIGLVGLISFVAAQKTKEISIRKIMGAPVHRIIGLLVKEFAVLVIVSGLAALPASYFIMNRWLRDYAYRTDITAWSLMAPILMMTSIMVLCVMTRVIRAAGANPVDSLKYE